MKPKVLIYDIETAPLLSYTWGLYDQNVSLNQVHTDWYVLSVAAKWMGEKKVFYESLSKINLKKVPGNDKSVVSFIWKLLDEADICITQNGKEFDQKRLNARFAIYGMQPPSPSKQIDTLKIAKKSFGFTSNKLAYLTEKLCTKYKKLEHKKYPGFDLWKECLDGNQEAWAEMRKYNIHDVLSLEELYTKLSAWDNSVNFGLYRTDGVYACSCGSANLNRRGFYYTAV